ncbi:hypothetical protein BDZ45DRAFT_805110 [Acephala macrosclerotiorum]|nr:hypothetical protein BDZ45DRAFT_805110 [Acephala macrosclerotiorum]
MAETREEGGRLDKERPGQHSNYSTASLSTSGPSNGPSSFTTSTSSTEAVDTASDNGPHYDATNRGHHPLGLPKFIHQPSYSATEHTPVSSSTISPFDLTNSYDNTNISNFEQQPQDPSPWTNNTSQPPEANNAPIAPSMTLFGMQPSCFHSSDLIREDSRDTSALLTSELALRGPTVIPTKLAGAVEHTNVWSTVYNNTLEAFAGSATDFEDGTPRAETGEHILERHQLEAWIRQRSDENMTITEKLEKDKSGWDICHFISTSHMEIEGGS